MPVSRIRQLTHAFRSQYRRGADDPPHEPGRIPWMGVALEYGKDAGSFLAEMRARHGDTFSVFLAGNRLTFVTNPLDYGAVLKNRSLDFHELAWEISATAFGHTLEGFAPDELDAVGELAITRLRGETLGQMTQQAQRSLEGLLPGPGFEAEVDLYDWVARMVFRATGRTVFGEGFEREVRIEDFRALDQGFPLLLGGVPARLMPATHAGRAALHRAMALGRDAAAQITLDRFRLFEETGNADQRGAYQTAFLWATQANTLPATFWTLFHVLRDPHASRVVTDEVRRVFAEAPVDPETGTPLLDKDSLLKLIYLDSALDEAMRLTSGSLTIRVALEDTQIALADGGTLKIRAGERVGLYPWMTHYDPEVYDDPTAYRFDRFVEDGKRRKRFERRGERVNHYLMPFGGGVSMCPGRHFARNEIKIAVALLLAHLDITLLDTEVPAFEPGRAGLGVLPPATDVRARVRRPA